MEFIYPKIFYPISPFKDPNTTEGWASLLVLRVARAYSYSLSKMMAKTLKLWTLNLWEDLYRVSYGFKWLKLKLDSGHLIQRIGIEPWKAWHDITVLDSLINLFIYVFYSTYYPILYWLVTWTNMSFHLHCIWLQCIRNCIKDISHGFLARWLVVYSWFIDLGNSIETIMHYLLIGGMAYHDHRDRFPMVSTLVCMVTYWTRPIVNHDIRLLVVMIHKATWYIDSQSWEYIEFMLKSTRNFDLWVRP